MLNEIIVLDYESYFGDDLTLKKLTTEEYIRGPKFEAQCLGFKSMTSGAEGCIPQKEIASFLRGLNPSTTAVVHHHAQFDGLISAHHYDWIPAFYFDTLVMARVAFGQRIRVGLGALCERFGLTPKSVPYQKVMNKHWAEMSKSLQAELMEGATDDCRATGELFKLLLPLVPRLELEACDMTTRLYTEPRLIGDATEFRRIHAEEITRKAALLATMEVNAKDINSNAKFISILASYGVEPEYKQGKNGLIPAFAKTDDFMQDMLVCGDEPLEVLAETRLATKSSLNETRALRMAQMSERGAGTMPVYQHHAKTQTLRPTGGDKCLVANTRVVVYDPIYGVTEKRIVDVLPDDLVWDGEEFVTHSGVIFQGYAEVIEYDGVTGTEDHKVFTTHGKITLAAAKERGAPILDCPGPTSGGLAASL